MLEINRLFLQKVSLLKDPNELVSNDISKLNIIAEIIWDRKATGHEPVDEAVNCTDPELNITKEIMTKFAFKYFATSYLLSNFSR